MMKLEIRRNVPRNSDHPGSDERVDREGTVTFDDNGRIVAEEKFDKASGVMVPVEVRSTPEEDRNWLEHFANTEHRADFDGCAYPVLIEGQWPEGTRPVQERHDHLIEFTHILCDRTKKYGTKRMDTWNAIFAVLMDQGDTFEDAVRLADKALDEGMDSMIEDDNGEDYAQSSLAGRLIIRMGVQIPDQFKHHKDLLDLTSTREGRQWWKANARGMDMEFDATPGSKSMERLERLTRGRDQEQYAQPGEPAAWPPQPDPESGHLHMFHPDEVAEIDRILDEELP